MWITKTSINQPVFATMVMAGLLVLGVFSYNRLRVERMPDITFPVVFIQVQYPGASPEAVENDITKPIEEVVNTVNGVRLIRSNSWEGRSETYIELRLDANVERAVQDVRDKVALVRPGFPREVKDPLVLRGDFDNAQPVVGLAVTSDTRSLRELSTMTDQIIVKKFQNVAGVGQVQVFGGRSRQVVINLRPAQMLSQMVGVVEEALQGVKGAVVEGALLTVFIVFLFLRSWRSTIITGLTLPISVIATFIAVYMFGFTLNSLTLMALSLCIGLLIDDAIVVRENIVRHLAMGKDHHTAAREGTDEIGLAVMATTFAIVAVFRAIGFMNGHIGRVSSQFAMHVPG